MPPDSAPPPGSRALSLARELTGIAARLAVATAGAAVALRLSSVPKSLRRQTTVDSDDTGRGPPTTPPSPKARSAGHETDDMRGGLMAKVVAGLFVFAVAAVFGVAGLEGWFEGWIAAGRPTLTTEQTNHPAPPPPRLQVKPVNELATIQAAEARVLDSYAWLDPAHERARIPIARAMALTVGKSLDPTP